MRPPWRFSNWSEPTGAKRPGAAAPGRFSDAGGRDAPWPTRTSSPRGSPTPTAVRRPTGAAQVRLALDGVDLEVRRGEFLAILGMNGSGKSTLARHLNALLLPRAGRVLVDGLDTREEQNLWPIRDRVGMVFQNPDNQIVAAVVEEDVAFGPENQGLPPAEIRARVAEALEAVGMSEHRERSPHLLSRRPEAAGGHRRRPGVAARLPGAGRAHGDARPVGPGGGAGGGAPPQPGTGHGRRLDHTLHGGGGRRRPGGGDGRGQGTAGPARPAEVFSQPDRLRALRLDLPPAVQAAERLRGAGRAASRHILTLDELVEALCQLYSRP